MNRETEMYHAAIRILENRSEQLGDDELMHRVDNIDFLYAPNKNISKDEILAMIDDKIEDIPSQQIAIISSPSPSGAFRSGNTKVLRDKQYFAENKLYDRLIAKITKEIQNDIGVDDYEALKIEELVKKRMQDRFHFTIIR